ncbi:MAG: hypothetical protein H3C62_05870 [Gemmatimonadaceae bacterium]|nr:hypothetical protein [Gemmatimonadaceae bacterium]
MADSSEIVQLKQQCASLTTALDSVGREVEGAARRLCAEERIFLMEAIPRLARERFAVIVARAPAEASLIDAQALRERVSRWVKHLEETWPSLDRALLPSGASESKLRQLREVYWSLRKRSVITYHDDCSGREHALRNAIGHLQEIFPGRSFPNWQIETRLADDSDRPRIPSPDPGRRYNFCSEPIAWPPALLDAADRYNNAMKRYCALLEQRSALLRKIEEVRAGELWDASGA